MRRDWDSPPADKKPEADKPKESKPAPDKKPAADAKSEKKPTPEVKSDKQPERKPATPPKKDEERTEALQMPSLRVPSLNDAAAWLGRQVPLELLGGALLNVLAADDDRPAPPPPPAEASPPRKDPPPRPHGDEGPRGPGGFGPPHGGPAHNAPGHGGSGHGAGPGPGGPGHSPGPWGHFDPERFKEIDPELYTAWKEDRELEKKTFELGEQYRRTKDADEKTKLKNEIAAEVEKHFDVRQKKRTLELKRFEEHLGRMKASIAKREEAKATILKERVDELTGEDNAKF